MDVSRTRPVSANITLPGYALPGVIEFSQEFERMLGEQKEEGNLDSVVNFKKQPLEIESDGNIPDEVLLKLIPEVVYVDDALGISIRYQHMHRRLIARVDNVDNADYLSSIVVAMLTYQSNKILALGYNYEAFYGEVNEIAILDKISGELSKTRINTEKILSSSVHFSYQDGEYKKTFKVISQEGLRVTANYHYDKFKNTKSGTRIREYLITEIKASFSASCAEFSQLSDEIVRL